jgi:hypothetical protein
VSHGGRRWLDPDAVRAELRLAGLDCIVLRTDEPFIPHLRHFLAHRDKLGRTRG